MCPDRTLTEVATAIQEKQRTQIEPPPDVFQPMQHDPWPWRDDETEDLFEARAA